jgi:hypothetical protein
MLTICKNCPKLQKFMRLPKTITKKYKASKSLTKISSEDHNYILRLIYSGRDTKTILSSLNHKYGTMQIAGVRAAVTRGDM